MANSRIPQLPLKEFLVEYTSNNSGGSWWLDEEDWYALEKAGWIISYYKDNKYYKDHLVDDRWLGAIAKKCHKVFLANSELDAEGQAIYDWENITGQVASMDGCSTCGSPHNFWATLLTDGIREKYNLPISIKKQNRINNIEI